MPVKTRRSVHTADTRDDTDSTAQSSRYKEEHSTITAEPSMRDAYVATTFRHLGNRNLGVPGERGDSGATENGGEEREPQSGPETNESPLPAHEAETKQIRVMRRYSLYGTLFLLVMCFTPYWHRTLGVVSAITLWGFPTYYCEITQEWLTGLHASNTMYTWFRRVHRTMAQNSNGFHGLQATGWSRAISCFSANTFMGNFLYILTTTLFANGEEDMDALWCVISIHILLWSGVITMHKMIPRPGQVFEITNRALNNAHASNFILMVKPIAIASIVKVLSTKWDALWSLDAYTIAFWGVFLVDVCWYTLRLFTVDDPMEALTRQIGNVSIEIFNLQYLMMGMLSKCVFVMATLSLSARAKRAWIFVELGIQLVSGCWLYWVRNEYVPGSEDDSVSRHSIDMGCKGILIATLFIASLITIKE